MEGIKPDSIDLSQDKGIKIEGIDEGSPEPDVGYPAKQVTPENPEDNQ